MDSATAHKPPLLRRSRSTHVRRKEGPSRRSGRARPPFPPSRRPSSDRSAGRSSPYYTALRGKRFIDASGEGITHIGAFFRDQVAQLARTNAKASIAPVSRLARKSLRQF